MFYISVSNGLLSPLHRKQMGGALWEFLWCLDRVTRIQSSGCGLVLGGKPINLYDLSIQLGTAETTTSRHLQRLAKSGYLRLVHTPYGIRIAVVKAKKKFKSIRSNPNGIYSPRFPQDRYRHDKNAEPRCGTADPGCRSVEPNKTYSVDISNDRESDEEKMKRINAIKLDITQRMKSICPNSNTHKTPR